MGRVRDREVGSAGRATATQRRPVQRKLGLLNLAVRSLHRRRHRVVRVRLDAVRSSSCAATCRSVRRRPLEPGRLRLPLTPASAEDSPPVGATLIVRDLATGRDTTFGNVSEYAWQDKGRELKACSPVTISADDKTGNGVQLFDPASGAPRPRLGVGTLRGTHVAPRGRRSRRPPSPDRRHARRCDAGRARVDGSCRQRASTVDPTRRRRLPAGMRTVSFRRPSWSDDGSIVFLGVGPWEQKLVTEKPEDKPSTTADDTARPASDACRRNRHRRHLAREGHRSDAAPEAERAQRSAAQPAGRLASDGTGTFVQLAQGSARAGRHADAPATARVRRQLGRVRDGAHDRPSGRRHLARRSQHRHAHESSSTGSTTGTCRRARTADFLLVPGGRSLLDDRHRDTRVTNITKAVPAVVREPRVGCDGEAEASLRRRRMDQGRRRACCCTTSSTSGRSARSASKRDAI